VKDSKWIGFDAVIRGVAVRIAVSRVTLAFEWRIEPEAADMKVAQQRAIALAGAATAHAGARSGEHWEVFIEGDTATARQHS
jgi:hypothetical protein